MSLDHDTIIRSILGSLVAMAVSMVLAFTYIRNQYLNEKKIQETDIKQGILHL